MDTDKSCGPLSFSLPFEAFEAFWWLLAPLGGFLGPEPSPGSGVLARSWIGGWSGIVRGPLTPALGSGALEGGPLGGGPLGPGGGPCQGVPCLAAGAAWLGGRPLARRGALGPGGGAATSLPGPLASLLVQESSYQGPGGPRAGGARQTLNPKPCTIWGYTLATLKVVWVPAIPYPSTDVVVKKADVRWPVQDRR